MQRFMLKIEDSFPRMVPVILGIVFLAVCSTLAGNVTYTISRVANPTADESDAYQRIRIAADSACRYYNTYTNITKKLTLSYNTGVATADGNINGSIRFGKNRVYMAAWCVMHEVAHTIGVGTSTAYARLVVKTVKSVSSHNDSAGHTVYDTVWVRQYKGAMGTAAYRLIRGDTVSFLGADGLHFWPYQFNGPGEATTDPVKYIAHCRILDGINRDLHPTGIADIFPCQSIAPVPVVIQRSGELLSYLLPAVGMADVSVFDLLGKKIATLTPDQRSASGRRFTMNTRGIPGGRYVFNVRSDGYGGSRLVSISR